MEFAETLKNIFGEYPSTSNSSGYKSETLSLQQYVTTTRCLVKINILKSKNFVVFF